MNQQQKIDLAVAAERRFLCLLWLDPLRGQEIAETLRLKPLDFLYPPHRHVFAHCLRCAAAGWAPTIRGARARLPTVTLSDLDAILFCDGVRDCEFQDYGFDVQRNGDARQGDELRRLTRETLKDFADYVSGTPRPARQPKTDGPTTSKQRRRYATRPVQWRRVV